MRNNPSIHCRSMPTSCFALTRPVLLRILLRREAPPLQRRVRMRPPKQKSFGFGDLTPADRAYVTHLVAAQTGISPQDAERRVNAGIAEAKTAADNARRGTMKLAFWLTAALFFGAFAASLAAAEGGQLRDGTWAERGLTKRSWA